MVVVYSKYEAHYILHLVHIHVVSFYDKLSEDSGSFFRFVFLKHSTEKDWHSTIEVVINKFAIMTIRLNRQINDQQCSHQTKRPLVFEEITPIFRYLEIIDETQEICPILIISHSYYENS